MEHDWDARAREAPEYYVATARTDWSPEDFFRSGEINVDNEILTDSELLALCREFRRLRVLEIGCGAGRMTRAMAAAFGAVDAVDISGEMIALARRNCEAFPNATFYKNNGTDLAPLPDAAYDFAFSFIVFQHIPAGEVVRRYVREVHRCLKPGGVFKFQVQGATAIRHTADDTWVGAPMSLADARSLAAETGFEYLHSAGEGTQYFWLWFRKPDHRRIPRLLRKLRAAFTRPVAVILPDTIAAGATYRVRIPAFPNQTIDIAYALDSGKTGIVAKWCTLDAHGEASIPVPPDHPAALVRITQVRSRTRQSRWRPSNAAIRVSRPPRPSD
jgi:SAM-dependent methyltransferase